jgi:hypothetical protein
MSSRVRLHGAASVALLALALAALLLGAPSARAAFGFLPGGEGFDVSATELDGSVDADAGSHPYELTTTIGLNPSAEPAGAPGAFFSDGDVRDIRIDRPPGLIENPTAVGACPVTAFNTPRSSPFQESLSGESCPDNSQVGTITVRSAYGGGTTRTFGLFNLVPPPGFPALIGASPFGMPITFVSRIRGAEGEYGISLEATDISQQVDISALKLSLWGNPWLVGHDDERGNCLNEEDPAAYFGVPGSLEREPQTKPESAPFYEAGTCSVGNPKALPPLAYLTLPTACNGPLVSTVVADAWQQPTPVSQTSLSHDELGNPQGLGGCDLPGPGRETAVAQPTTDRAASPAGFNFTLERNQDGLLHNTTPAGRLIPSTRAPTQVRTAVVDLPEGMTINPSVAAGLGVCTPAGYAAETAASAPGAGCPNDSKIGELKVESPLFGTPIEGGIFLAQPYQNPFGSLLALYLVAKAPDRGVIVKLAGELSADPGSGRLVATFVDLPQLPYSHLVVAFREGQRSPLATPPACGSYVAQTNLTGWLEPGQAFSEGTQFQLSKGIGGGACPAANAPFAPQSQAGTLNRNAGSYSSFYLHLTRSETDQEITGYSAKLPPGLLGKLAGVPFCPEAAIAAAHRNGGFAEAASPSCPAASQIGHTTAGYGLGSVLAYAPGALYLAGPYHGSPLSVVAVDPATVGPFDLGTVVIRSAVRVDPLTAQVSLDSTGSDPIPHILKGIPIHLRDVRVYIDRPGFMVNPTSCERFAIDSTLNGSGARFSDPSDDTVATISDPFQVSFCSSLDFAPRFALQLGGGTRRGRYPSVRATVTPRPGDANIGRVAVTLPPSEFLAQNHIRTICTLPQSAAERCPAKSIYGRARATTPLLDGPLEGPVYLRSSQHHLPDLVATLHGEGIRIDVVGRIDSVHGRMRVSYEVLPDAPVTSFVMTLPGGKRGLLVNSDDVCTAPPAQALFIGQNNATRRLRPRLTNPKCARGAKRKHKKQKAGKRHGGRR